MKHGQFAVLLLLALAGCVSKTTYGPCVGLNGGEDSTLVYHGSERNIAMGIIFSELIVPPIKVALDEYKCPVGRKPATLPHD